MKRLIDLHLRDWLHDSYRKPLLLRGARQVGKTFAVRALGATCADFVEINLELLPKARAIFTKDLQPERIIRELSLLIGRPIIPGKTLLFFDEIQAEPQALIALRYFYEMMPQLHVIAAGSLLDFAIEQVGIPVGRVQSLYMYPMSFIEFLVAVGEHLVAEEVIRHETTTQLSDVIHHKLLALTGEYLALGGMPEVIHYWASTKDPLRCSNIHRTLLNTYRQDFGKYARNNQVKYVDLIFNSIPHQLGHVFKYNIIEGEYRKRELAPALDLLVTAGIAHKVFHSSGHRIPLGAQMDPQDYRAIFLDIGLSQAVLNFDLADWFIDPLQEFINKGALVEAFVGQEILAYSDPTTQHNLYYWHRKERTSTAEVDYLLQQKQIIPIEVKSGSGRTLKSINMFLDTHSNSPYGIRFSTQNYSHHQNIHSYPLYAIAHPLSANALIRKSMEALLKSSV